MDEREWRFIDTDFDDAFLNMSIDEAILDSHIHGLCPPTLRVYTWSPPAISLGYFQDLETEIEVRRCSELGVDIVRRLTGGRAILHDEELTYSVVTSEQFGFPRSLAESYRLLNRGLIAAYGMLGLEVSLEAHPREPFSAACFSSAGLADLTFQGRKLCGSAQYRKSNALLQHGSLPIRVNAHLFFSLLKFPSNGVRERAQEQFEQRAISLSEVLGNTIGLEELRRALFNGFQGSLGIKLCEDTLTDKEFDCAQSLAIEKYKSSEWNCNGNY